MKRFLAIAAVLIPAFIMPASSPAAPVSGDAPPEPYTLKEEMALLDAAFKKLIDALINNDHASIGPAFQDLDAARVKTEEALEAGALKLPKNSNKTHLFRALDSEFHKKLERLIEFSKKRDMKAVRVLAHKLLDSCVECHNNFRRNR